MGGVIILHCKGEQNLLPENMSIWHKDYFRLITFLKDLFAYFERERERACWRELLERVREREREGVCLTRGKVRGREFLSRLPAH